MKINIKSYSEFINESYNKNNNERIVEGINVSLYEKNLNSDNIYVVYQDKLYKQIKSKGHGKGYNIFLEKKSTNEYMWVSAWKNDDIKYVISNMDNIDT